MNVVLYRVCAWGYHLLCVELAFSICPPVCSVFNISYALDNNNSIFSNPLPHIVTEKERESRRERRVEESVGGRRSASSSRTKSEMATKILGNANFQVAIPGEI